MSLTVGQAPKEQKMEKHSYVDRSSGSLVIDPDHRTFERPVLNETRITRKYRKSPLIAAGLSLVPGLGHFYAHRKRKGWALICVDVGIVLTFFMTQSFVLRATALVIYALTLFQAGSEAYVIAKTGKTPEIPATKQYVVLMLLVTGFSALPLLWQDKRFSGNNKVLLTLAVPFLAFLYFGSLILWGPQIEKLILQVQFFH